MALEVLREIVRNAAPASGPAAGLPPGELRFTLEFAAAADAGRLQAELRRVLESDAVKVEELFPGSPDPLDRFALLRIVGVRRTLPADALFEISYALAAELDAVSVEPDTGARVFEENDPNAPVARTEAALVRGWCNVDDPPPPDKHWALKAIRAPEAWALSPGQGAGIVIGQPDTGVVPVHAELEAGSLDLGRAINLLEAGQPPHDPLKAGMANPGHGTGTSSCVVSRAAGEIQGSAPAAQVAPIRCINDVKVFDAAPVARAIDHARRAGCHVISMSLGGLPNRSLHAALKAAVDANLIVVAAAGNCVRFVVWPARYDECIAVGGVNIRDKPWKGSSRGGAVDISAPAENVWKANAMPGPNPVHGGQGTSFATALTAGVAALWLAHNGRDALVAEARRRGVKLQRLFRAALAQTARRPAVWDAGKFGPGIVDARALLELAPADIRIAQHEAVIERPASNEIAALIAETSPGLPLPPANFDWARYGLELASVAADAGRRASRADSGATTEIGAQAFRPSRSLLEALQAAPDVRHESLAPPVLLTPSAADDESRKLLRILGPQAAHESLESAPPPMDDRAAAESLRRSADKLIAKAHERMRRMQASADSDSPGILAPLLRDKGRDAIARLGEGVALTQIEPAGRASLEAIVMLTGRPALRVQDDRVNVNDPQIGEWQGSLVLIEDKIPQLTRAVGRIDVDGQHVGTGFLIAPGLVMTNRHVLEVLAAPVPSDFHPKSWVLSQPNITIDFKREAGSSAALRFAITGVAFSGPTPTNDTEEVEFSDLDLAVVRIAPQSADGKPQPAPLSLLRGELDSHLNPDLLVIGYPAKPKFLPRDEAGKVRQDVAEALMRIYGLRYGVKYLSPGRVSALPGAVPDDPVGWIFNHDASTLPGNSGSCVIRYGPELAVIGLHFAGVFEHANHAHALVRLASGNHLPADLNGAFKWVEE